MGDQGPFAGTALGQRFGYTELIARRYVQKQTVCRLLTWCCTIDGCSADEKLLAEIDTSEKELVNIYLEDRNCDSLQVRCTDIIS